MTAYPQYAERDPDALPAIQPSESEGEAAVAPFDEMAWTERRDEQRGAGGRAVLGSALALLAVMWLGYTAWAAGRALAALPLGSPAFAQWVATAAGPLALLGLIWLMFGRTRRKEAEQFTRSVIAMRTEARALEDVLAALSRQIDHNHEALGQMAGSLIGLGDETATRLAAVTADLGRRSTELVAHGASLDRAAENVRTDLGVMMADLPLAEQQALRMAEALRAAGQHSIEQAGAFQTSVQALGAQTARADATIHDAASRLVQHLTQVESAGAAAALRIKEASDVTNTGIDALLARAADSLLEIRGGIDAQAAAVAALVAQASSGIGRAGIEAAEALGSSVSAANSAIDGLSARVAEQERSSQRIAAETGRALAELDQHFSALAEQGDLRAANFVQALGRARSELQQLSSETSAHDCAIETLAAHTTVLRETVSELSSALAQAESGTARLAEATGTIRPELDWMRQAATEASDRISYSAESIAAQQDRFAALLASLDDGVGNAEQRLATLAAAIASAQGEASRLSNETGPALVEAMVQVKEAAAHAADRAREAIGAVIPQSAQNFSDATREALERVIQEQVTQSMLEVETTAARAVEAARAASDRLTQQMLTLGQSAAALEHHVEKVSAAQHEKDSEAFGRRVSLLIDSMHSASIDVGKILSDEIDDKAWDSYMKGNRGVFTRRAVRLMEGSETRAIRAQYETDPEFQQSANRYIHDFEAMLRRVVAERDGGMIAVTLMSSDTGKLYAALAQSIKTPRT